MSVHEGRREEEIKVAWKSLSVSVTKVFSEREETRSLMRWMYGCLGVEGVETVVGVELEGPRGGLLARWRKDAYDASSAMTSAKVVRRIVVGGPSDLHKRHPFPIE